LSDYNYLGLQNAADMAENMEKVQSHLAAACAPQSPTIKMVLTISSKFSSL